MPHRHRPLPARLYLGIHDHFPARRPEWALAGAMAAWGYILASDTPIFTAGSSWLPLAMWADEATWGVAAVWIGCLRLVALIVNGTFAGTWYGRWSPHVRAVAAAISSIIWALLVWGLFTSDAATTGRAVYPAFLFLELTNVWIAAGDAREADGIVADDTPRQPIS